MSDTVEIITPRRYRIGRAGPFEVYVLDQGKVEIRDRHDGRVTIVSASVARNLSKHLRAASSESHSWNYFETKTKPRSIASPAIGALQSGQAKLAVEP
jgi:hypothetical protein